MAAPVFDSRHFRRVLGHFPTGVAVVASMAAGDRPVGMAVGSFTSVSLDPPLVAFLPDKKSSTFPKIREAGKFCVNILSADQQDICRAFAAKGENKFQGIRWQTTDITGSPLIDGVVAWIDCEIETIHDAGDHHIVIGRVLALESASASSPLLFFQGGYGRFASPTLTAPAEIGLLKELHYVDLAASEMQSLASATRMECLAVARQGEWQFFIGSAGSDATRTGRIGQRQPHAPPLGGVFEAWEDDASRASWMKRACPAVGTPAELESMLNHIRDRGWSFGLGTPAHEKFMEAVNGLSIDHPTAEQKERLQSALAELVVADSDPVGLAPGKIHKIRSISAPVFGSDGRPVLALALFGFKELTTEQVLEMAKRLTSSAASVTRAIGGRAPRDWNPRFH